MKFEYRTIPAKFSYPISVMCVFFILSLTSPGSMATIEKLSAAWELWYPYQYRNSQGQVVGIDIRYFKEVMRRLNMAYTLDEIPWNRHLELLKEGELDIAFAASRNQEREGYAYFSIPYRIESIRLFMLQGETNSLVINNLNEVSNTNMMVGIEKGYFYGHEFERLFLQPKFRRRFHVANDIEDNVKLMIEGKLQGILVDPLTMDAFSKKYQLHGYFEAHPVIIFSDNVYFMFSKKSVSIETVNKINVVINQLKQSGEDRALLKSQMSF